MKMNKKNRKVSLRPFLSATPLLRLAHPPARPHSSQVQSYVDAAGAAVRGRVRFFSAETNAIQIRRFFAHFVFEILRIIINIIVTVLFILN